MHVEHENCKLYMHEEVNHTHQSYSYKILVLYSQTEYISVKLEPLHSFNILRISIFHYELWQMAPCKLIRHKWHLVIINFQPHCLSTVPSRLYVNSGTVYFIELARRWDSIILMCEEITWKYQLLKLWQNSNS